MAGLNTILYRVEIMTTISLDYDDTYTKDPELWLAFVKAAKARKHRVCVVTMRFPHEGRGMDPRLLELCEVFYTSRQLKRAFMERLKIQIDIWIDDRPDFIC